MTDELVEKGKRKGKYEVRGTRLEVKARNEGRRKRNVFVGRENRKNWGNKL
jgi:hypothetical protein